MNRLTIRVGAHLQAKSDVADRRIPGGDNGVTVVLFSGSLLTPRWRRESAANSSLETLILF